MNYANRILVLNDFNIDGKIRQKLVTDFSQFNDKRFFVLVRELPYLCHVPIYKI